MCIYVQCVQKPTKSANRKQESDGSKNANHNMVYLYDACDQISDFCHQQLLRKMRRKISWTDGRTEVKQYTLSPFGERGYNKGFYWLSQCHHKFYSHHHDLVDRCGISVSQMTTDMFPILSSFMTYHRFLVWCVLLDLQFYV